MKSEEVEPERSLYRFEYLDDGNRFVDWVWLSEDEVDKYMTPHSDISGMNRRRATADETELYDEAYEDGYGVAMVQEIMSSNNGLTYRIEFNKDSEQEPDANGLTGHRMFECATCSKHKDFESEVAVIETGPWYLATLKDTMLWFNCYDCTSLGVDISGIEYEIEMDWDSDDVPDEDQEGK